VVKPLLLLVGLLVPGKDHVLLAWVLDALKWRNLCELQEDARTDLRRVICAAMLDKLRLVLQKRNINK
jgi:hypothetical protein